MVQCRSIFVLIVLIINGILYSKDLNKAEYVPNEIILKLSSETKIISPHSLTTDVAEIDAALLKFAITDISPVVPYKKDLNQRLPDINRIYRIKYTDSICLLYTSPSPRDLSTSRMPSSA